MVFTVVNFCLLSKLIVKAITETKDYIRQKEIENFSVRFLRFDESLIYYNLDGVVETIIDWVGQNS